MYNGNLLRVDGCCVKRKYSCRTTVFVGNLPYDVSENELITHFQTVLSFYGTYQVFRKDSYMLEDLVFSNRSLLFLS